MGWAKTKFAGDENTLKDIERAVKALHQYPAGMIVGDENDATSLRNVKEALKVLVKYNEQRVHDEHFTGLDPLGTTFYMMATAISNADNSANPANGHTRHFNGGENLAWGYTDPNKGWYEEEKVVWEALQEFTAKYLAEHPGVNITQRGPEKTAFENAWTNYAKNEKKFFNIQTGHYTNAVNRNYIVTGIGRSTVANKRGKMVYDQQLQKFVEVGGEKKYTEDQLDSYGITFSQTFSSTTQGQQSHAEKIYTIAEFTNLFDEYMDTVDTTKLNAKLDEATKKYNDAVTARDAYKGEPALGEREVLPEEKAYDAAVQKLAEANTALTNAQKVLTDATTALENAKSELEAAKATRDSAKLAHDAAKAETATAQSTYDAAKGVYDAKVAERKNAEADAKTADDDLSAKTAVVDSMVGVEEMKALRKAVADAKEVQKASEKVVEEKQNALNDATNAYNDAVAARNTAQANVDTKTNELATAQSTLEAKTTDLTNAELALKALTDKVAAYDAKVKELEDSKAEAAKKAQAYEDAKAAHTKAMDALVELTTKATEARAKADRTNAFTFDETFNTLVSDPEFASTVNPYIEAVQKARAALVTAKQALTQANEALEEATTRAAKAEANCIRELAAYNVRVATEAAQKAEAVRQAELANQAARQIENATNKSVGTDAMVEKKASDKQKEASKDSKNDKQDAKKSDEKKTETQKNDKKKDVATEEKKSEESSDDTVAKVGIGALVATALAGFGIVIGKKKKKDSK